MSQKKTKVLCVLDGFGFATSGPNNSISLADMSNFKNLLGKYPWTTLDADGSAVGQETGLVGNSEVGHMNIGGLKLVPQLSYQITQSAKSSFDLKGNIAPDQNFDPKVFLQENFKDLNSNKTVHLVGLFSTGTIHSDLRHWAKAIAASGQAGTDKIVLHIISDGRDSDPKSLLATWGYFVDNFGKQFEEYKDKVFLGSVGGRFYAMDRDKNWDRVARGLLPMLELDLLGLITQLNYNDLFNIDEKFSNFYKNKFELNYSNIFSDLDFYRDNQHEKTVILGESGIQDDWLLDGSGNVSELLLAATYSSYGNQKYDENILSKGVYPNLIQKQDSVWLINFRTDRFKQLTQMLCEINNEFELGLKIMGMNDYGVENIPAQIWKSGDEVNSKSYYCIFKNKPVQNTLADFIESEGKSQLHIAETEKFNHVTYFMNGGQNKKHSGEDWVVIDSNKVQSHAEKTAMKAVEITDYILENGLGKYDYIIVNYANPDMVAHTGNIQATIESLKVLDQQLGRLVDAVQKGDHALIITADHGNAEKVGKYEQNDQTLLDTEHNPNPVPMLIVDDNFDVTLFLENLKSLNLVKNSELANIEQTLKSTQLVNLDSGEWLDENQIPKPKFPLWYVGLFLITI